MLGGFRTLLRHVIWRNDLLSACADGIKLITLRERRKKTNNECHRKL